MDTNKIEISAEEYKTLCILSEAFKKLLKESDIGVTVIDKDGKIIYLNELTTKKYSHLPNFLIGKSITESFPKSKLLNLLKNPKNAEKYSIESLKNNNKVVINRFPMIEAGNNTIGAFSTTKDVKHYQELELNIRKNLQEKGHLAKYSFDDFITANEQMKHLINIAKTYSASPFPILIQGESGTGKELFAQSIHNASNRKNGPFVALNCSTLTESLLETELFGYSDSSFTGARKGGKIGLFQEAHQGTIFLDEIGEMPLSFQSKLLRVLQEKEVRPVGSGKIIPVDVRVVAATNKNLREEVENGNFRLDLWYRLNVLSVNIIPLRERPEDIEAFSKYYIKKFKNIYLSKELDVLIDLMKNYNFPGNIRELENILERFVLTMQSVYSKNLGTTESINNFFESYTSKFTKINKPLPEKNTSTPEQKTNKKYSAKELFEENEKNEIQALLIKYNGSRSLVAKELNISVSTLRRRMIKYNIHSTYI